MQKNIENIENMEMVIDYIEEHLTKKLDLDIISGATYYSKYHLHRMFVKMVGLTIHDYVQRRKLTEAAKLLVFSNRPIIEIAFMAGYESQQAFTSVFKAMYKQSPNQFRENKQFYPLQLKFVLKKNPIYFEYTKIDFKKDIRFATFSDIPDWMDLVSLVVDGFPYLIEKEYLETLKKCMIEKRALIIKDDTIVIGIMIFSYDNGNIDFLGIHPQYRKQDIAKAMLAKVIDEFLKDKEISITTFREGDKADTGYRKMYKNLGFRESELLIEFGYPTQKFILNTKIERI